MEIKELEARMYYLAGQLDEAKKIYREALGEVERANKEQAQREAAAAVALAHKEVPSAEPATV